MISSFEGAEASDGSSGRLLGLADGDCCGSLTRPTNVNAAKGLRISASAPRRAPSAGCNRKDADGLAPRCRRTAPQLLSGGGPVSGLDDERARHLLVAVAAEHVAKVREFADLGGRDGHPRVHAWHDVGPNA